MFGYFKCVNWGALHYYQFGKKSHALAGNLWPSFMQPWGIANLPAFRLKIPPTPSVPHFKVNPPPPHPNKINLSSFPQEIKEKLIQK